MKKWSVTLFASYVVLGYLITALATGSLLFVPGFASILILISMANQWRLGNLT
jgi:hypothetical protein